jgi:hypothetical protein
MVVNQSYNTNKLYYLIYEHILHRTRDLLMLNKEEHNTRSSNEVSFFNANKRLISSTTYTDIIDALKPISKPILHKDYNGIKKVVAHIYPKKVTRYTL